MMTMAKGPPMPTAPPITIAIAKSKPAIACQDIYTTPLEGKLSPPRMADQSLLRQVKCA